MSYPGSYYRPGPPAYYRPGPPVYYQRPHVDTFVKRVEFKQKMLVYVGLAFAALATVLIALAVIVNLTGGGSSDSYGSRYDSCVSSNQHALVIGGGSESALENYCALHAAQ